MDCEHAVFDCKPLHLRSRAYCLAEARCNIENKRPLAQTNLEASLADVKVVPHAKKVDFSVDLNVRTYRY